MCVQKNEDALLCAATDRCASFAAPRDCEEINYLLVHMLKLEFIIITNQIDVIINNYTMLQKTFWYLCCIELCQDADEYTSFYYRFTFYYDR